MKQLKKIIILLILIIIFFANISNIYAINLKEKISELDANINSEAALIMESSTGKVIYEKNGNEIKYPASTTKIMTAILAIENCELDELATASEYAITSIPYGYATADIRVGESLSIKDLLYVLMLHSANESAIIIAEHISGSVNEFSKLMNQKAKEIGCKHTHFINPNGIHDDNHYSTAYDLALIANYCMQNETFREIVKTTSYTLPNTSSYQEEPRTFTNTNSLVVPSSENNPNKYYYQFATGVKTGYTTPAKNCLISSAQKNGIEYICVVLGADSAYENNEHKSFRYLDSISLFNYAFENFDFKTINSKNDIIETIQIDNAVPSSKDLKILIASDVTALINNETSTNDIQPQIVLKENLQAPIIEGEIVGTINYKINGISYTADLLAGNDIKEEEKTEIKQLNYWIILILLLIIIIIIIGIIILHILLKKHESE